MKRASTLLALLLALCIAITAWAEGGGIALEIPVNAPRSAGDDAAEAPELELDGDGIAVDLPSADLSLSEDLSLPDPEASADIAPDDGGDLPRANATPDENFTITDDGVVTYVGHGGDVEIKDKINGVTVTAIADGGFSNNGGKYVTKVTLPGTVTRIGASAFSGCVHLVHIKGTSALTEIGNSAFYGCSKLVGIDLPDTLTSIGASAFSGCTTLEAVSLPDDIQILPDSVFYGCTTLSSVKLPRKLESLGSYAFYNCINLKRLTLPANLESIGAYCFSSTGLLSVKLPEGVAVVPPYAFSGCASLTKIQWGEIETIGEYAFAGCVKLYSMSLPYASVTDIGQSAFSGCASLRSVTMPKGIVAVKDNTFNGCTLLNKVKMADGITSIGIGAFQNCTNLKDFNIPKAVRSIGASAFMNTSLTHAEISKNVRTIDTSTFQNCRKLSKVTIAGGVKGKIINVRDYAFAGCASLKAIVLPDTVVSIGTGAFSGCESLTKARLPKGTDEFTEIRPSTFQGCKKLKSVNIPAYVKTISANAFEGCEKLAKVTWEAKRDRLESIGNSAFSGCAALTAFGIPSSTTVISQNAFAGCAKLRSITVPKKVVNLEAGAFAGCAKLKSVKLKLDITELKSGLFQNCAALTAIDIPDSVETIASNAFAGCASLRKVAWGKKVSLKTIGAYAFSGCAALKKLSMPGTVEFIDNTTFSGSPVTVRAKCGTYGASWAVSVKISRDIYRHRKVVVDPARPATTTSTGLTKGKHCEVCGEVIKAQEVTPMVSPQPGNTMSPDETVAPGATVTPAPTGSGEEIDIGEPEAIRLNKKGTVTLKQGKTLALKVTFSPRYASSTLSWRSSKSAVATVSKTGKVKAVAPGTAKITVTTSNGLKASVTIRVPAVPATKVAITAPARTVKVGRTLQLKASLTPSDATDKVTWKSSNAGLAKVSQTGKVTGVKKGAVTITATAASGKAASVKITVN